MASSNETKKFFIFFCCIVHVKLGHHTIMFIEQSIFLPETGFFLCLNLINFHGTEFCANLLSRPPTSMFCIVEISLKQGGRKSKEERYGWVG